MKSSRRIPLFRIPVVAVLAAAALLSVGAVAAGAHGGGPGGGGPGRGDPGDGPRGLRGPSTSALVTEGAKQLGVTRAALVAAIRKSANAQIDAALEDEAIDADQAAELEDEVDDNLSFAYRLSRASQVATNLGVTTTKLNAEFRDARRALATARIDKALANGDITAARAAELKTALADADLPGYKGFGFGFGGHHR
jgi:hypothetical protein